jgi:hypothetical protein
MFSRFKKWDAICKETILDETSWTPLVIVERFVDVDQPNLLMFGITDFGSHVFSQSTIHIAFPWQQARKMITGHVKHVEWNDLEIAIHKNNKVNIRFPVGRYYHAHEIPRNLWFKIIKGLIEMKNENQSEETGHRLLLYQSPDHKSRLLSLIQNVNE